MQTHSLSRHDAGLWARVFVSAAVITAFGCISPARERADETALAGYPTCATEAAPVPMFEGALRAGEMMREESAHERFRGEQRGCHVVFTGSQDWNLGATDLEVVYDAALTPIRAWKRATSPGPREAPRRTDIRAYDFTGAHVLMRRRSSLGEFETWRFRAATPHVIIGPGRGLLSMWLQRAHLEVGGRVREPVLDIRETVEIIRDVTLMRLEDREDAEMGRVRVYTIYGREPFFADEHDVVVGDMMGMRPARLITTPLPPAIPREGDADPRGTP